MTYLDKAVIKKIPIISFREIANHFVIAPNAILEITVLQNFNMKSKYEQLLQSIRSQEFYDALNTMNIGRHHRHIAPCILLFYFCLRVHAYQTKWLGYLR